MLFDCQPVQEIDSVVEVIPVLIDTKECYEINKEMFTLEFIEEMQREIEEENRIREEQERLEAIRIAEEIAREQERQRVESVTFDPYDLTKPSNLTGDEMYDLLKDTGLKDVAYTYIQAEKRYGVNAFVLAGLSALESSWGTSSRAVNDNNLTGYNIKSNSDYYSFSSRSESLLATAKLLGESYLSPSGKYYSGTSIWDVNNKYCPPTTTDACKGWADKISNISQKLYYDYKRKH